MIAALLTLAVVGVVLYLVNAYLPMPAPIKTVINAIVVILLCLYILNLFNVANVPHLD